MIAPIEKHIRGTVAQRDCPEGDEFHFCEAKSFIMPTGLVANDVPDFFQKVAGVTNPCLHFHFFEARLRLGRPTNDFSRWLQAAGEPRLARAVERLHPYTMTLDELKDTIVRIGKKYLLRDD